MRPYIFVLICFAYVFLPAHGLHAQEVKVLTYNIYHGERPDGSGKSNLEEVAALIKAHDPDLVALQEVDSMTYRSAQFNDGAREDLVQELARLTGMHGYFGKAMDYSSGGYGEGLLSRVGGQPEVSILETPAGGEPRALIAITHTFSNGKKMVFAGTHLCHEFEENKLAQAKQVARILGEKGLPAIVAGDFNFTPDSDAYEAIAQKMDDAAALFGNPQRTYSSTDPRIRLDYVFISRSSKWKVKAVEVIPSEASDHLPVLVTLQLE